MRVEGACQHPLQGVAVEWKDCTRLWQERAVLPLVATGMGRNGSMLCGRYDDSEATGLDGMVEACHLEGEALLLPLHLLVVDQRGQAVHVCCTGAVAQDSADSCRGDRGRRLRAPTKRRDTLGRIDGVGTVASHRTSRRQEGQPAFSSP